MPSSLRLWNNLSAKKEEFRPAHGPEVRIYCCGPTVYGYTHVGNARAALTLDTIVRILMRAGYSPVVARNYTDVDDKIIEAAKKEKLSPAELALKYEHAYASELKDLGTLPPQHTPRATENIEEMIQLSQKLIEKGHAYVKGHDVYFRVPSFSGYGKLSRRKLDDMIAGVRIEADESKEHPADFALWKGAKEGEPSWSSPWGPGRPGWHIECSAMIHRLFGESIDIHMGGIDLVFPHHENEIAQSECATGKPLAKYWIHNGLLEINSEKMSKSLGNIVRTHEFISKYGADLFRLLVLSFHYRSPIDFSDENIQRTDLLLHKLNKAYLEVRSSHEETLPVELPPELSQLSAKIDEALFDDFHTAKAFGLMMSGLRVCFREDRPAYWRAWGACLPILQDVFGILIQDPVEALDDLRIRKLKRSGLTEEKAQIIEARLLERLELRKQKQFAEADLIRDELLREGVLVMDTSEGSTWMLKD